MSAKEATIKDIARKAGVSYATVSRALNGKYGVKAATRDRILSVARRLGYRPNAIARGLVTRRTMTIGLIVPDITNPFFPEVAGGVEDAAREAGYGVLLCNARAMGEFGATLMVAGNIPGRTQTLAMAIYDAVQANDLARANSLALLLTSIAFGLLFVVLRVNRRIAGEM